MPLRDVSLFKVLPTKLCLIGESDYLIAPEAQVQSKSQSTGATGLVTPYSISGQPTSLASGVATFILDQSGPAQSAAPKIYRVQPSGVFCQEEMLGIMGQFRYVGDEVATQNIERNGSFIVFSATLGPGLYALVMRVSAMDAGVVGMDRYVYRSPALLLAVDSMFASAHVSASSNFQGRIRNPGAAPGKPDLSYTDKALGVTVKYPADFEREGRKLPPPFVALFYAPKYGDGKSPPGNIQITCSLLPPGVNITLDQLYKGTVTSGQKALPGAVYSEPVSTTMAGAPAVAFLIDGQEGGITVRKVVTLAVCRGHNIGVVLNGTPESFDRNWDAYKRVCDSYELR